MFQLNQDDTFIRCTFTRLCVNFCSAGRPLSLSGLFGGRCTLRRHFTRASGETGETKSINRLSILTHDQSRQSSHAAFGSNQREDEKELQVHRDAKLERPLRCEDVVQSVSTHIRFNFAPLRVRLLKRCLVLLSRPTQMMQRC